VQIELNFLTPCRVSTLSDLSTVGLLVIFEKMEYPKETATFWGPFLPKQIF
jgi:hypothetical protein